MQRLRYKIGKVWRALGDRNTARALLRYRVAVALEHRGALWNLHCRTVVDIGANRGQFALVARYCFPDARIISFEPLFVPAKLYQRVFEGDQNVSLYHAAIGPDTGRATMHISKRDDSSSLLPITERQNSLFPGTFEEAISEIKIGPLKEFVRSDEITAPALLKVDVQGYELEALKGSEELLEKFDYIYAECSFVELYKGQAMASEVIGYLYERGFGLEGAYNSSYDPNGKAIQADLLFMRRKEKA